MASNFLASLVNPELRQFLDDKSAQEMSPATGIPSASPLSIIENPASVGPSPQDITNILQTAVSQTPQVSAPARERRSMLDMVGRAADVLARVGGADALYQPTLDADEARLNMRDDRGRAITLQNQQIDAGADEAAARDNALVGQAVRGLQAIQARGGDVSAAWPLLAQQAGIPADRMSALGEIFTSNPQSVGAVAAMLNGEQNDYGLQPFYATDANGTLRAYQLGKDGTVKPIQLEEGETPIDPLKFVDLGGTQAGVGTRSGRVRQTLDNSVSPDAAANIQGRDANNRRDNSTRRYVADRRPGPAGKNTPAAGSGADALANLQEIRGVYDELNKIGAMVSPEKSTGANIAARVRASKTGQLVEGAVGTQAQTLRDRVNSIRPALMQSIAKATGMTGKQLDSNADVKLFMQTVTDPTTSYEANQRAIAGLERFIKSHQAKPAAPARRNVAPRAPAGGGGWGKATVVR